MRYRPFLFIALGLGLAALVWRLARPTDPAAGPPDDTPAPSAAAEGAGATADAPADPGATATVVDLLGRYTPYGVSVTRERHDVMEGRRDTLRYRYVYRRGARPNQLVYGEADVRMLWSDTIYQGEGPRPDTLRATPMPPAMARVVADAKFWRKPMPEQLIQRRGGWREVAAGDDDGRRVFRLSAGARAAGPTAVGPAAEMAALLVGRRELDLVVDARATTVLAVEERHYVRDTLELLTRHRFSDWDAGADAEAVAWVSRLPRVLEPAPDPVASYARVPPLEVGRPAPPLVGRNLDGDSVAVATANTVLFFSFIACQPCAVALDRLRAADYRLAGGARLVYVDAVDPVPRLRRYLRDTYGAGAFEAIVRSDREPSPWNVRSAPTFVRVDAAGVVREIRAG